MGTWYTYQIPIRVQAYHRYYWKPLRHCRWLDSPRAFNFINSSLVARSRSSDLSLLLFSLPSSLRTSDFQDFEHRIANHSSGTVQDSHLLPLHWMRCKGSVFFWTMQIKSVKYALFSVFCRIKGISLIFGIGRCILWERCRVAIWRICQKCIGFHGENSKKWISADFWECPRVYSQKVRGNINLLVKCLIINHTWYKRQIP